MKIVGTNDVRRWFREASGLAEFTRGIGATGSGAMDCELGVPDHLQFLIRRLVADQGHEIPATALDSIPFYSLCKGLFLPLSMLDPARTASMFGIRTGAPPDTAGREKLLKEFLNKDVGISLPEKIGCILGDVFQGKRSSVRRDSLVQLFMTMKMMSRRDCLDRLTQVGDIAVMFAELPSEIKGEIPLTAGEVIRTLRYLPSARRTQKFQVLRSLYRRCGRMESYFLTRLILQKAGLGFEYQGTVIARLLAEQFGVEEEQVGHAMALTDAFKVAQVLIDEGAEGLRKIQLQPLVPVRPMLAGGITNDLKDSEFPVWVERKYDGIRLLLHKSTDTRGSVLCGAYTRNRGDWLEQISGLDASIRSIPAHNCIVDGELFGTILDIEEGMRPATVYEVYAALQGESAQPVTLRFAAFDLLYLNNMDITSQALQQRRQYLMNLLAPLTQRQLPIPITVSEGQMATGHEDVNRLFQHFRSQGYEGIICKQLNAPYRLASRDPGWKKRKPEITLDLAILGATQAVTTRENAGMFGSYVIGARNAKGGFDFVGDVAGIDRVREQEIIREIMQNGLMTGQRIERPSASGARPGIALRPHVVVTVRFEGIARDQTTGALSLRDPKLVVIRSDKPAMEADTTMDIQEMYLRQRVG
ncbi:MAG: hypothetical protein KDA91_03305 [Planctomycetaceae bacterium]|nr:hypothetical protein [Planctomycetaceae bacterium]